MESGKRDMNGEWIPETPQAKLRNRLSLFWTLSEILFKKFQPDFAKYEWLSYMKSIAENY